MASSSNPPSSRSAPRTPDAPSRSAICKVSYPLLTTPPIVVIPIEITSGTMPAGKHVRSQKLRKQAIREIVKVVADNLPDFKSLFAIQTWVAKDTTGEEPAPTDHVVFLTGNEKDLELIQTEIDVLKAKHTPLKTVKYLRTPGGELETEVLHYTVHDANPCRLNNNPVEYWEKLNIIVRRLIRSVEIPDATCSKNAEILLVATAEHQTPPGYARRALRELDEASLNRLQPAMKEIEKVMSPVAFVAPRTPITQTTKQNPTISLATLNSPVAQTIRDAEKIDVLFRLNPKLDPVQGMLHFELNLVPGARKNRSLSEVILSTFGRAILGSGIHQHFPAIRGMLIGLKMSRNYLLPEQKAKESESARATTVPEPARSIRPKKSTASIRSAMKGSSAKIQTSPIPKKSSLTISTAQTPEIYDHGEFVVQDVQLAGDVTSFLRKDGKRFTVTGYFKEVHKTVIAYPNLPLAKVGRDSWIPLEMLKFYDTQVLSTTTLSAGLLNDVLAEEHDIPRKRSEITAFADLVIEKLSSISTACEFMGARSEDLATSLLPLTNSHVTLAERKLGPDSRCPALKIGVIYVASNPNDPAKFSKLATDVHQRLRHAQVVKQQSREARNIINIDTDFHNDPLIAVIANVKPLLLPGFGGEKDIQAFVDRSTTTIFAIIDTDGHNKSELRSLRADLHKFGERKLGAVVYCTTRQNLMKLLDEKHSLPDYFPVGPLWRLSEMHGGQNFEVENMQAKITGPTIVLGAHVSHQNSRAARYCPSVAAVVASTDAQLMQFPGSVRLQNTYLTGTRDGDHKYDASSEIVDLGNMLRDRLQAWKTVNGDVAPNVVFYHSGIDIVKEGLANSDALEIVHHEMRAISDVFEAEFKATPTLSYILVSKRTQPGSPYGWTSKETSTILGSMGIRNFSNPISGVATSKYKYYVWSTVEDVPAVGKLLNLTKYLNDNYQGDRKAIPTIALPVPYAEKLAICTFDYFRFATTNKFDEMSAVTRCTSYPDGDRENNGVKMKEFINDYLLNNEDEEDEEATIKSGPWPNNDPWLRNLNNTMFYL